VCSSDLLALWVASEIEGYNSGLWATYRQWRTLGAQVRKKQKGSVIVFCKKMSRDVVDEQTGETETASALFARASYVFNVDQVDGWDVPKPVVQDPAEIIEHAETFVRATGAHIEHGGDRAYYRPSTDHIQVPDRDCFTGTKTCTATEGYYSTLFHELTHWTSHKERLDRSFSDRFGKEAYAMEELVAELGSAFLCSELSITNSPRLDHASYIQNWLMVLKNDKRAIFTSASKANDAKNYLLGLRDQETTLSDCSLKSHIDSKECV
jgi:antirestriction protein ArdC